MFLAGLSRFRRRHRLVHWFGVVAVGVVWAGTYATAAVALADVADGFALAATAAVAATVAAGATSGLCYLSAVGTPSVDLAVAPAALPLAMPAFAFAALAGGTTASVASDAHATLALRVACSLVGVAAAFAVVAVGYDFKPDPGAWERAVLPQGFRLRATGDGADDNGREGESDRPGAAPSVVDLRRGTASFDPAGSLTGMTVALAGVALSMYVVEVGGAPLEQAGGPMALALLYGIYRSVTIAPASG